MTEERSVPDSQAAITAEQPVTDERSVPDRQAAIIAGLLILAMVFFGAMAKHDNPSWNKMVGQAKKMPAKAAVAEAKDQVKAKGPDKD